MIREFNKYNDIKFQLNGNMKHIEKWGDVREEYKYETNEFEVGDRIIYKNHEHWGEGTIIYRKYRYFFCIEFDKYVGGHDCGGMCKMGHGYHLPPIVLQLINKEEDIGDMEEWEDDTNEDIKNNKNKMKNIKKFYDVVNENLDTNLEGIFQKAYDEANEYYNTMYSYKPTKDDIINYIVDYIMMEHRNLFDNTKTYENVVDWIEKKGVTV